MSKQQSFKNNAINPDVPAPSYEASQQAYSRMAVRNIPFIKVMFKSGIFCFSSEKSFELYKKNRRELELFKVSESGELLGVPLFRCVSWSSLNNVLNSNPLTHKIYKYIAIPLNSKNTPVVSPEIVNPEWICFNQDKTFSLYEFEFCQVHEKSGFLTSSLTQVFDFQVPDETTGSKIQAVIQSTTFSKYDKVTFSHKPNMNLEWKGSSLLGSIIGAIDFTLEVLDDVSTRNRRESRQVGKWANFSDASSTTFPSKKTWRCGDMDIGETVYTRGVLLGQLNQETEITICMVFILYDHAMD